MKTIMVTGDLVWDTHIARLPWVAKAYHLPHLQTQLLNRYGGAWFLRDVIKDALAHESIAPKQARHEEIEDVTPLSPGGIAKGFSVWEWYQDEKKSGAWRIKEFLGCQSARWEKKEKKDPDLVLQQTVFEPPLAPDAPPPDVLVIDDLGLGFACHEKAWPSFLSAESAAKPQAIIAKMSAPFDRPLWKKLLSPEWASRVTVVIAAATLRDVGARLGTGFSWDATIEEVRKVFAEGGAGWCMRFCERVVVTFGRSGAAVFSRRCCSWNKEMQKPDTLRFERFVFDPAQLEKTWSVKLEGTTFGTASVMAALLVADECREEKPSSHITVSRGLAAARELHRLGAGGTSDAFMPQTAKDSKLPSMEIKALAAAADQKPEHQFRSAFDRTLLDDPVLFRDKKDLVPLEHQTLLMDAVGMTPEFLTVAAAEIVRFGKDRLKTTVPFLEWDEYFTVDRSEIESLNTLRNLILDYRQNAADKNPLSVAIFGQPGSGKSFAIKRLASALFGKEKAVLEYNLSQFEDIDALHEAFHEVRDKSVQGQLPLVFWDEFDSSLGQTKFGWLKEFLAPMQDAKFFAKGKEHPFGKCIFIFAGGTSHTYEEFAKLALPLDKSATPEDKTAHEYFTAIKGPDFQSRLRGKLDIKGPNRFEGQRDDPDNVHILRRALLLRSLIERHHKSIIQHDNGELVMQPSVLDAFLRAEKYFHGARSMEAIVSLSRLHGCRQFGPSELPPKEVVQLHVTEDFSAIACSRDKVYFTPEQIERLAELKHEHWRAAKEDKTHPFCKPWAELDEAAKEGNRSPARLTLLRLAALDYEVRPQGIKLMAGQIIVKLADEKVTLDKLSRSEHRRWMREKLLKGVSLAEKRNDALLLHQDIRKFADLEHPEQQLDSAIISAIEVFLGEQGLVLVRTGG